VEAKRSGWSATWMVDRPSICLAVDLLQTNLAMSVGTPLCPYISPATAEVSRTHSTCSSPLVKVQFSSSSVGEVVSGVKSRVEHSLELWK
jgi:hypothetical protein